MGVLACTGAGTLTPIRWLLGKAHTFLTVLIAVFLKHALFFTHPVATLQGNLVCLHVVLQAERVILIYFLSALDRFHQ